MAEEATRQRLEEQEESEVDPDYENISEPEQGSSDQTISENDVVDVEANVDINERFSSKKRKPPSKNTRPKTSWIWKFFKETEGNSKVICEIEGCGKIFTWCGSPSSMKTHLSGTHHITKGNAANYLEALQTGDQQLINDIIEEEVVKSHPYSKQELLTKNVIGFIIGTV